MNRMWVVVQEIISD